MPATLPPARGGIGAGSGKDCDYFGNKAIPVFAPTAPRPYARASFRRHVFPKCLQPVQRRLCPFDRAFFQLFDAPCLFRVREHLTGDRGLLFVPFQPAFLLLDPLVQIPHHKFANIRRRDRKPLKTRLILADLIKPRGTAALAVEGDASTKAHTIGHTNADQTLWCALGHDRLHHHPIDRQVDGP